MPKLNKSRYLVLIDVLLIVVSVLFMLYVLPKGKARIAEWGFVGLGTFTVLWFGVSALFKKYAVNHKIKHHRRILLCNAVVVGVLMLLSHYYNNDMKLRDGTYYIFVVITLVELVFFRSVEEVGRATNVSKAEDYMAQRLPRRKSTQKKVYEPLESHLNITAAIQSELGDKVADYLSSIEDFNNPKLYALSASTDFTLKTFPDNYVSTLLNIRRMNDIKHLNSYLRMANAKLEDGGHFVCCVEVKNTRKKRILAKYPPVINWGMYSLDYVFKRIFPRLKLTRRIYFFITRGQNRILTFTEVMGRLYGSGFELMTKKRIGNLHYLQMRKVAAADKAMNNHYGMFIKLSRVGKDGKMINVYKMRTMHPYAEYIQAYVYDKHGTDIDGKLKDDFRLNSTGQLFRRFWLDELPMVLNFVKGEMKFVGVRPLSMHRYKTYPVELQEKRIKVKPGLFPPYYADMPKGEEEVWTSEDRYLDAYMKHPWRTDWQYFWKAFRNIVFKGERSA